MVALHQKFMKHKTNCIPHLDQRWGFFAIKIPCYQMIARNLLFSYALARGVTYVPVFYPTLFPISTHAPARVRRWAFPACHVVFCHFNSRTREGCDRFARTNEHDRLHFNSRTREGCDRLRGFCVRYNGYFNSRTREGCDASCVAALAFWKNFNSRTREGCDGTFLTRLYPCGISTHAPARGATPMAPDPHSDDYISTHAPARGATAKTNKNNRL